jgi:hypothetical protein
VIPLRRPAVPSTPSAGYPARTSTPPIPRMLRWSHCQWPPGPAYTRS